MTALSLKPVEAVLQSHLDVLNQQLQLPHLTPTQKQQIQQDITNVQALINGLPNSCHRAAPYDLGV